MTVTLVNSIMHGSAWKFMDGKLSSGLSSCHCAPNCVESQLHSYNECSSIVIGICVIPIQVD